MNVIWLFTLSLLVYLSLIIFIFIATATFMLLIVTIFSIWVFTKTVFYFFVLNFLQSDFSSRLFDDVILYHSLIKLFNPTFCNFSLSLLFYIFASHYYLHSTLFFI